MLDYITWAANPEIFSGFVTIRWYGLMFAIGFIGCFVGAYIYLRYQLKHYQAETQELSHDA